MAVNTGDNRWATSNFIVAPTIAEGAGYTTIAAAITAAGASGDIFIKPGTYTENLTLTTGINLIAFAGDATTPNVTIIGKIICTDAGTRTISNIRLQTNSDFCLSVTGSVATVINLNNCFINASNNTAIQFTSSSASAQITLNNCQGNIATTGIAYFAHSSAGRLLFNYCSLANTGGAITNNICSAGTLTLQYTIIQSPITTSSTGIISGAHNVFACGALNTTALTQGGGVTSNLDFCFFGSSNAAAISISSTLNLTKAVVQSTVGTFAITGAGTLKYTDVEFTASNTLFNPTLTLTPLNTNIGGISFDGGVNTLSTYTEGTFTPTMVGTVAGTTTYTAQVGRYIRIGNLVTVQATITGSAATGTGNIVFGNLPFAVRAAANTNAIGSILVSTAAGWVWPAGATSLSFQAIQGTSAGTCYVSGSAISGNVLQMANAAFNFQYTVTYEI